MNLNRGHESEAHRNAKTVIGRLFDTPEWSVFYEQRDADILVMHNAKLLVVAIEAESSPRNVSRNLERDFAHGCDAVAVVPLKERYFGQIARKVLDAEKKYQGKAMKLFTYTPRGLQELRYWITSLTGADNERMEGDS